MQHLPQRDTARETEFHNIGVSAANTDPGRFAVTNQSEDDGRIQDAKPSKRRAARPVYAQRAIPDARGSSGVLQPRRRFQGDRISRRHHQAARTDGDEKAALVAFMKRPLTDARVRNELPPFDRPKLFTESNRVPVVTGVGRAGSGGHVPEIAAVSPPIVGNPTFPISVGKALGNSPAVLVVSDTDPGVGSGDPGTGDARPCGIEHTEHGSRERLGISDDTDPQRASRGREDIFRTLVCSGPRGCERLCRFACGAVHGVR